MHIYLEEVWVVDYYQLALFGMGSETILLAQSPPFQTPSHPAKITSYPQLLEYYLDPWVTDTTPIPRQAQDSNGRCDFAILQQAQNPAIGYRQRLPSFCCGKAFETSQERMPHHLLIPPLFLNSLSVP